MGKRVPELAAVMTNGELASWFAYDRISPIGDDRMDFLFARLCLLICDAVGLKKIQGGGKFEFDDFLMWNRKPAVLENVSPLEFLRGRVSPKRVKRKD